MKPHEISVYSHKGRLFVVPSLPTRAGMMALDTVVLVERGPNGLLGALQAAERIALTESKRPASEIVFGDNRKLVSAAGCRTFREFAPEAISVSIVRTPKFTLVSKLVPGKRAGNMVGKGQQQLPATTSLRKLASLAEELLSDSEPK